MTNTQFREGDAEWTRLRAKALGDLYFFAGVVLGYGDRIPMRKGPHALLCKFAEKKTGVPALDTARYRKIEMPRETGKTTIITQAYTIQCVCADPNTSILIVNEKVETAQDFLSDIKHQFETNEFLRALFPELIPPDLNETTWSAKRITVNRTANRKEPSIFVIGVGGTVTGLHPDKIICDDIISREAMENARAGSWQTMHQTNRWIHQLDPLLSSNALPFPEVIFTGTRWWHGDSYEHIETAFGYGETARPYLLKCKLESGEVQQVVAWRMGDLAIFRRAAIEDSRSIFPEKWDLEKLAKLRIRDEALFACLPSTEQVLGFNGPMSIAGVVEGDALNTKEWRSRRVVATSVRDYEGDLVNVYVWGQGVPARLTPNHSVWTERGWVRADELVVGDVLSVPLHLHPEHIGDATIQITAPSHDPDFWFLVGHFIGDGTINKKGVVSHCFNKRDTALAEKVAGIVRRLFARKCRIEEARTTLRITYRHPTAAAFFAPISHGSAQKWLASIYECLPLPQLQALVDGYWSADGCTAATGHRVASSVSHTWLCQLQRILARLGTVSYVSKGKPNTTEIEGRTVNSQPLYLLWIYTPTTRKTKKWIAGGRLYHKIRKLTKESYSGPVHNCEVDEDHSYVSATNVLTYKNCNYMNEPSDELTATFKASWLQYYDWLDDVTVRFTDGTAAKRTYALQDLDILIFVDPGGFAERQVEDRANAAVIVTGSTPKGEHLILDAHSEKDTFLACIRHIVDCVTKYSPRRVYVEQAGQQAAFVELLRQAGKDANLAMSLEVVKPGIRAKEARILTLEPYFQRGQLFIGKSAAFHQFKQQFSQFPRAARLDLLDALAYGPQSWRKQPTGRLNPSQRQQQELDAYYQKRGLQRR